MRDVIRVKMGERLKYVEPTEYLWDLQWERMGCHPGFPGWPLVKFVMDTVPWHRMRLVILFDIEPLGEGIKFEATASEGRFRSSPGFLKRYGFSFDFAHEDYTLGALDAWFMPTTDGDWSSVFSTAA